MRIHGVLRLAAAPAIALALVATPAVARQSSTEVRPKTEPKPSAPAAVSRPPAVQSRPASPPPSRPAIERSTPRSSPSNQFRMPRFERPIDRETLRGPEVIRTPASLRRGEPRTNSRTNARMTTRSALAPTRVIDPSLILDDDVAVTLRLDDFSPIERARILLELQELMDRHLGANEESAVGDDAPQIAAPEGAPHPPHVPNTERPVLTPPSIGDDEVETPPTTTPPPTTTRPDEWDWLWWRWSNTSNRFSWIDDCSFYMSWLGVSLGDRFEFMRNMYSLSRSSSLNGVSRRASWHQPFDGICIDRYNLGPELTWEQYVSHFKARAEAEQEERVDCARVTVQRFDGAAASFEVGLPALGAETLGELRDAITDRLIRGESVPLAVVLKPGDVEDVSVGVCKSDAG